MIKFFPIFFFFFSAILTAQVKQDWYQIVGSAYLESRGHSVLERICDEAGPRVPGTLENEKATQILKSELESLGYQPKLEKFTMPGWVRGEDKVVMIEPTARKLTATALAYTNRTPEFTAPVCYVEYGLAESFQTDRVKDKIALVTFEQPPNKPAMAHFEIIKIAAEHGMKAVLFMHSKSGMYTMAKSINLTGQSISIPVYSVTYEEGKWMQRLLERSVEVKLKITAESYCKEIETSNVVVTIPGEKAEKIVVGAHFDSWDLGQGSIDNGIGSAILFDIGRVIKSCFPKNLYTIELVWFQGEEMGLWGAKRYIEMHSGDTIVTMVNMDMTGTPTGFNAMGFDELVPFLESLHKSLPGFDLKRGVINQPWGGSDHVLFILEGIPCITLQAYLEPDAVHYHQSGDTFDKVNKKYLSDATAVIGILLKELANDSQPKFKHYSRDGILQLLKKYKWEELAKKYGLWRW